MSVSLSRLTRLTRQTGDWLESTDPGLTRLRTATRVLLLVGSVLGIELAYASTVGIRAVVPMVLGAAQAMISVRALSNPKTNVKIAILGSLPLAMIVGLVAGGMLAKVAPWGLIGFIAITFLAVWVQRLGQQLYAHGFLAWMAYFYALLLKLPGNLLPLMILSSVIASGWVIVISLTMMRARPRRDLEWTLESFRARVRDVADAGLEVLRSAREDAEQTLYSELRRLNQTALLIDGRLGMPGAVPQDVDPSDIRTQLMDAEITASLLVDAILELNGRAERNSDVDRARARTALEQLKRHGIEPAAKDAPPPANGIATELSDTRRVIDRAQRMSQQLDELGKLPDRLAAKEQDDSQRDPGESHSDFKPAVQLNAGQLPQSQQTAQQTAREQSRLWWTPLARLDLITREAIQVGIAAGLALAAGYALSHTRYYWALLAAYVAFSRANTSDEAVGRAIGRAVGTLLGFAGAIVVAGLTNGNARLAVLVILLSMFLAFYVQPLSYAVRVFFITIVVAELFDTIHIYSIGLMLFRTELTAVGAAIGLVVSLVVLPTNSADTSRTAQRNLLKSIAGLLNEVADRLTGSGGQADELAAARQVDSNLQQLSQVMRPVSKMMVLTENHEHIQQQLAWYTSVAVHTHGIAAEVSEQAVSQPERLATACRQLAAVARDLANQQSVHLDERLERRFRQARSALAPTPDTSGVAFDNARRLAGTLDRLARSGKSSGHIPNLARGFSTASERGTAD